MSDQPRHNESHRNDGEIPTYGQTPSYGQTPNYGQTPQNGYGASGNPGGGSAYGSAAPMSPELERQLVCAAHWSPIASVLLGGMTFFGPLIVLLVGGGRSRAVREHALDALNFQITIWLATIAAVLVSLVLMLVLVGFVTIWLAALIPLVGLVFHGIAAVRVAAGEPYRYPMTLRIFS